MLYGTPIRLPGEFLSPLSSTIDPATFVGKRRETMQELLPLTPRQQAHRALFVSKDLSTCSHVFLRSDTIKKGLQSPYEGPFQVLSRSEKVLKLLILNRQSVVNIDRLKPIYISKEEENTPSTTEKVPKESSQEYATATPAWIISPTKITRSGQHVHFNRRYLG
ncbi:integrase catalytic domain-containing protein [Caerostris darwini]|uniref:Integrase catalytic domain-containing protein n=1 Tax=Caerostris darwini TaxID=1538125 RepID=A0AAV4N3D1_9ARAC|nr:integrase catalytic domain-containing protein [Caerostris darwini]